MSSKKDSSSDSSSDSDDESMSEVLKDDKPIVYTYIRAPLPVRANELSSWELIKGGPLPARFNDRRQITKTSKVPLRRVFDVDISKIEHNKIYVHSERNPGYDERVAVGLSVLWYECPFQ
jgi:hypothetical protein